jgi:hypothetical protein
MTYDAAAGRDSGGVVSSIETNGEIDLFLKSAKNPEKS